MNEKPDQEYIKKRFEGWWRTIKPQYVEYDYRRYLYALEEYKRSKELSSIKRMGKAHLDKINEVLNYFGAQLSE